MQLSWKAAWLVHAIASSAYMSTPAMAKKTSGKATITPWWPEKFDRRLDTPGYYSGNWKHIETQEKSETCTVKRKKETWTVPCIITGTVFNEEEGCLISLTCKMALCGGTIRLHASMFRKDMNTKYGAYADPGPTLKELEEDIKDLVRSIPIKGFMVMPVRSGQIVDEEPAQPSQESSRLAKEVLAQSQMSEFLSNNNKQIQELSKLETKQGVSFNDIKNLGTAQRYYDSLSESSPTEGKTSK